MLTSTLISAVYLNRYHCMVGTGEVMTGGVSALLLIVPLFKSGTCAKLVQCGALVEQVRFILPENLFYFFFIYKSVQRSSCMTKLFFIHIISLDHNRRFQDRHALHRKEELTLLYWRVLIYECCSYARVHISISARVDLGSRRVDDPAHLRLCPINRTHQIQPACSPSL